MAWPYLTSVSFGYVPHQYIAPGDGIHLTVNRITTKRANYTGLDIYFCHGHFIPSLRGKGGPCSGDIGIRPFVACNLFSLSRTDSLPVFVRAILAPYNTFIASS